MPLAGGRWRRPLHPLLVALAGGHWAWLRLRLRLRLRLWLWLRRRLGLAGPLLLLRLGLRSIGAAVGLLLRSAVVPVEGGSRRGEAEGDEAESGSGEAESGEAESGETESGETSGAQEASGSGETSGAWPRALG